MGAAYIQGVGLKKAVDPQQLRVKEIGEEVGEKKRKSKMWRRKWNEKKES